MDEQSVPWTVIGPAPTNFDGIGFSTNADVRFAYEVTAATASTFFAEALGDTNGDGNRILYVCNEGEGPRAVLGTDSPGLGATTDIKD